MGTNTLSRTTPAAVQAELTAFLRTLEPQRPLCSELALRIESLRTLVEGIPDSTSLHPATLCQDRALRILSAAHGLICLLTARGEGETPHPLDPALCATRGALRVMIEGAYGHACNWLSTPAAEVPGA